MKLKTRLMVAFCIIIILPIALAGAAILGLYRIQTKAIQKNYGLEASDTQGVLSNSLQLMSRYTKTEYDEICKQAKADPEKLESVSYLAKVNTKLQEKSSYLIFCKNGILVYNGYHGDSSISDEQWEKQLPSYGEGDSSTGAAYYVDNDAQSLLKQVDFESSRGDQCSVYIITSSESIQPEIKKLMIDIGLSVLLILALTAGVMTIWIYRGTMVPIKKLQVATKNIKEGNLDFTIDYDEPDEMGDLCRNFEDMRKRLKESTEEKMAAEKENRALISNIAHDLKTPITAVKGYSEGILDGVADTPEKQERYIRTIYNKANEMDRLLNELTLYSKIDTNRIPYNFKKINVSDYFNDCIEEIGLDLETRGIGLTYFNYADENIVIIADPEQLMRVVNNIVTNAIKYMDKQKGQINVRIKDVGDFIQVEIEDNGKGISARDLPYIFDRFYRTDSSRNSSTGGSGIGLSIVKKIIEDHGGKIWATSKEKTGTTMYFVIRKYQEVPNE